MSQLPHRPRLAASNLQGELLKGVYHVEEKIAHGGMAWVYRARHVVEQSLWAIKVLFPHHAENTETRARFLRESSIQNELEHPHIVRVHDVLEERGVVGYIMEWCDSGDLRRLLPRYQGLLPLEQMAPLFWGVLKGIQFAHQRGLVHRDLKPENILMSRQPNGGLLPRITDFGIAKVLEETGHTETGSAIGTFSYMSPEQFVDSKNIDARSDIYSLGVILYFLCTGRLPFPFQKNSPQFLGMILKVQEQPPPPPTEAPAALQPVILRCLEKAPGQRYQSAAAFEAAFVEACGREGIPLDGPIIAPGGGWSELPHQERAETTPAPLAPGFAEAELEHTPFPKAEQLAYQGQGPPTHDALHAHLRSESQISGDFSAPLGTPTPPLAPPARSGKGLWFAGGGALLLALVLAFALLRPGGPQAPKDSLPSMPGAPSPSAPAAQRDGLDLPTLPPTPGSPSAPRGLGEKQREDCARLANLLHQKKWKRGLVVYRALLAAESSPQLLVCRYQAMSEAFPETAYKGLREIASQLRVDARLKAQAQRSLKPLEAKLKEPQVLLQQLRSNHWSQAQRSGAYDAFVRSLDGLLSQYPTMLSLHRFAHQTRSQMAEGGAQARAAAAAASTSYLEALRQWEASGLASWLRALWEGFPSQSALQKLQAPSQGMQVTRPVARPRPRIRRRRIRRRRTRRRRRDRHGRRAFLRAKKLMRHKRWSQASRALQRFLRRYSRSRYRGPARSLLKRARLCANAPPWASCQ